MKNLTVERYLEQVVQVYNCLKNENKLFTKEAEQSLQVTEIFNQGMTSSNFFWNIYVLSPNHIYVEQSLYDKICQFYCQRQAFLNSKEVKRYIFA